MEIRRTAERAELRAHFMLVRAAWFSYGFMRVDE